VSTLIKINPRIGWRNIGNEVVLFNCSNQQIVVWNKTASELWAEISRGVTKDYLVNLIDKKYTHDTEKAQRDVICFLEEAAEMGFIDFKKSTQIPEKDFQNGENALLYIEMKAIKRLIPFAVTFETTYSCNENCIHCYMDKNLPNLRFLEIQRILKEISDAGCLFVTFTGGEFFSRKDAINILECANEFHFAIDILSNGTLINENIVDTITKCSVRRVQISLYGATAKTHDSITRLPGSFNKTIKGIKFLRDAGIKVEIAFPMMKLNFHERYSVMNIADSMNCLLSPNHIVTARNNGDRDTYSLRITNEQLNEFLSDKNLFSLYAGRKPFHDHLLYLNLISILDAPPCYSGFNTCAITPQGEVLPCNQFLYSVGNLQTTSFKEIWKKSPELAFIRNLRICGLPECSKCDKLDLCSRCPGLALLEGGDLLGISPENCRITETFCKLYQKGDERL